MKKYDQIENQNRFFGNAEDQGKLIASLKKAVDAKESRLHLITGGTATGKTHAINAVRDSLEKNSEFTSLISDQHIEIGSVPEGVMPLELRNVLKDIVEKIGAPYRVYRHKTKPLFVVLAQDELPPAYQENAAALNAVADLMQKTKEYGYQVCWMESGTILQQKGPIFKTTVQADRQVKAHTKAVAGLLKKHDSIIVEHPLHYDVKQMREFLWKNISEYGQPYLDYLRINTDHWERSPEWARTVNAARNNDRKEYDHAFDVLALREQRTQRG